MSEDPKKKTIEEMFREIDVREHARRAAEHEEARQRRVDLTAARLFANGTELTAKEAYVAADELEKEREAFIASRKAGT